LNLWEIHIDGQNLAVQTIELRKWGGYTSSNVLLLAASTILLAQAQNSTNTTSTPKGCGSDIGWLNAGNSSTNSTGQREFRWTNGSDSGHLSSDPWYLSVTINDTVRRDDDNTSVSNGGIALRGYISVPDDVNNASLCVYQSSGANATLDDSADDNSDSCGDLMSDECKEFIKDSFLHEPTSNGCPRYQKSGREDADAFKKACPNLSDGVSSKYSSFRAVLTVHMMIC
jgi:hypothetical protein